MSGTTILSEVAQIKGTPRFVRFNYTAKESGEVSQVVVALGADLRQLYAQDLATVKGLLPMLTGVPAVAAQEVIKSLENSLTLGIGNNPEYTKPDVYVAVQGLPGTKVKKDDGTFYVTGLVHSKTVLVPGTYKTVKSSEKTIAKNKLRKTLASSKFREYILTNIRLTQTSDDTIDAVAI